MQWRTEGGGLGGSNPPPPEIPKAFQNRAKINPIWKLLKIADFRGDNTSRFSEKKSSKIL